MSFVRRWLGPSPGEQIEALRAKLGIEKRRGSEPQGPYVAVCGKCNVPLELHPVDRCPHEYIPMMYEGRRIGFRMIDKKNKNGRKEKAEKSTA